LPHLLRGHLTGARGGLSLRLHGTRSAAHGSRLAADARCLWASAHLLHHLPALRRAGEVLAQCTLSLLGNTLGEGWRRVATWRGRIAGRTVERRSTHGTVCCGRLLCC